MTDKRLFDPVFRALREFENLIGEDRTDAEHADKASEVLALLMVARQQAEAHVRTHPADKAALALKKTWLPILHETRQDALDWLLVQPDSPGGFPGGYPDEPDEYPDSNPLP